VKSTVSFADGDGEGKGRWREIRRGELLTAKVAKKGREGR